MNPNDSWILDSPPEDENYQSWLDRLTLDDVMEICAEKIIEKLWLMGDEELMAILAAHYNERDE